jgi:hypothetical protein
MVRFAILDIARLKAHERTEEALVRRTAEEIRRDGVLRIPILVEDAHFVILDGHHRYEALRVLGCRRVPVYLVDYDDPRVAVTTWPEAELDHITKATVVEHGVRGQLFPPKTSRHRVEADLAEVPVPLDELL